MYAFGLLLYTWWQSNLVFIYMSHKMHHLNIKRRKSHKEMLLLLFQYFFDRKRNRPFPLRLGKKRFTFSYLANGYWFSSTHLVTVWIHVAPQKSTSNGLICAFKARASSKCRFVCMCTWHDLSYHIIPCVTIFISFSTLLLVQHHHWKLNKYTDISHSIFQQRSTVRSGLFHSFVSAHVSVVVYACVCSRKWAFIWQLFRIPSCSCILCCVIKV